MPETAKAPQSWEEKYREYKNELWELDSSKGDSPKKAMRLVVQATTAITKMQEEDNVTNGLKTTHARLRDIYSLGIKVLSGRIGYDDSVEIVLSSFVNAYAMHTQELVKLQAEHNE